METFSIPIAINCSDKLALRIKWSWSCCYNFINPSITTHPPGQNGRHFTDDILLCIVMDVKLRILTRISLKFVPKGSIGAKWALVQVMATTHYLNQCWSSLPTHICGTRAGWVDISPDADILYVHDDVIKWKHFPRNWSFVRGIHRSSVNSPHKGLWRGDLMFSLICPWINGCVNNGEAGDLRRHCAHYDVTAMVNQYLLIGYGKYVKNYCYENIRL